MLFSKKLPDDVLINNFWMWFQGYCDTIKSAFSVQSDDVFENVLNTAQNEIEKATPLYKRPREYEFGGKEGEWEFNFYHLGNGYLKNCALRMTELMPDNLKKEWKFNIAK